MPKPPPSSPPSLRDLQEAFLKDCIPTPYSFTPENAIYLNSSSISTSGLMGIYHHSGLGNIEHVMALTYPVILSLVGEQFFHFCVTYFAQTHRPPTPDIDVYGEEFADFLSQFEPAKTLPYLPDIARLEWLYQQAALAPRAQVIDGDALSTVPQEHYFNLYLHLPPSAHFFASKHPVDKIWQWNQDDNTDLTPLNLAEEEGGHFLIHRPYSQVSIIRILSEESAFLQALAQGGNLYDAFEAATAINAEFDLAHYLQRHITLASFSGFAVGT